MFCQNEAKNSVVSSIICIPHLQFSTYIYLLRNKSYTLKKHVSDIMRYALYLQTIPVSITQLNGCFFKRNYVI